MHFPRTRPLAVAALALAVLSGAGLAQPADGPAYGPELQGYDYPFPVHTYAFLSQRQQLHMAYLDVRPAVGVKLTGPTAVLLHGKNFCAATWAPTISALSAAGYRVIAPDQIGFCKSSKPGSYQFTFRQLAQNTYDLLDRLGIKRATIVGHSTGAMLAAHYALLHPEAVDALVLVDPLGLEDWSAKGVPPVTVEQWYNRDVKTTADSIRAYERATYYADTWADGYEGPVQMLAGMYRGPGREQVAWDSALLDDMIATEPVVYRLGQIRAPTLLLIGDKDVTAIGKDFAPPEVGARLGRYPELGRAAAAAIPGAKLVEFPDLGHAPQMSDPEAFHAALLGWLAAR